MCDAGVDVITQVWVESQIHPFPDFSINRKCRNFDALLDWQDKNKVEEEGYAVMRMPEGHIPYRMSDEFKEKFAN